ncbi:uncharacterized protein [Montipora foliosa]|uniref:uncharacterized protein isoform X3 n=1 Tax=Montipora foliosa TaxID=591990 RepID=UPI0035F18821
MASGSWLQCQELGPYKVQVTILSSEWGSSKGGLSTINRELAIQLAKFPEVQITFFLPKCSYEDKSEAHRHGITILEATQLPGFEELDWLNFPPEHLRIDVIVGHGVKLGRQAQVIRNSRKCKWIQMVHTDPEELGMFKCYENPISKGEEKHNDQVELCKLADFIVGVGPKLAEAFRNYLRSCQRDQDVIDFTPGIFDEFVSVQQVCEERKQYSVLVFGRGDAEDFELKGFDIAARSVASLHDTRLVVVGAPDGKHEQIANRLLKCGIPKHRLRVKGYIESRETLKGLFATVDLLLMPSRTEGFGLTGLEALSAGLPVLVSKNSGFGEALSHAPFGSSFVIGSEDPNAWTVAITDILSKNRQTRLLEAQGLRDSYGVKYSWSEQCKDLLKKMINSVNDASCEPQMPSEAQGKLKRKFNKDQKDVSADEQTELLVASKRFPSSCLASHRTKDTVQPEASCANVVPTAGRSSTHSHQIADCESDIRFFAERHDPDTRNWLFDDFNKWFSDPGESRAYVLLGDAGVGKSVIAGALAQRMRKAGHLGAAYFCHYNDDTRNDPRCLLGTVASQLCKCNNHYNNTVGGIDNVITMLHNDKLGVQELFTKLLEEPLAKCTHSEERKLVIIDALDETEYESRKNFLCLITKRFLRLPQWLMFFITSRPEGKMRRRLEEYKHCVSCVRICAGDRKQNDIYQQHEGDIRRFFENGVDFSLLRFTVEEISKSCNGLFLHAFCLRKKLNDLAKTEKMDYTLSDLLVDDCENFFEENFERVFSRVGKDLYEKLIGCVLAAPSPLPVSFIPFVLQQEASSLDKQEVIDAVMQFALNQTANDTVTFLHKRIPTWLKKNPRKRDYDCSDLLIDKKKAEEYLARIFEEILSGIVTEPSPALSCINENLQDYAFRFAIRFLCKHGNQESVGIVFRCLTNFHFLEKRIESGKIGIYHLLEDLRDASCCSTFKDLGKKNILHEISSNAHVLLECPHLLMFCLPIGSKILQETDVIPNLSGPKLEWSTFDVESTDCLLDFNVFATALDQRTVAVSNGRSIAFVDASRLTIMSGPFEVSQKTIEEIKHLEFSPDEYRHAQEFNQTVELFLERLVPCHHGKPFCKKLEELLRSIHDLSLTAVRRVIVELYLYIFDFQIWNINTGRPLLYDVFSLSVPLNEFTYFWHVIHGKPGKGLDGIITKASSISNIAVACAVHAGTLSKRLPKDLRKIKHLEEQWDIRRKVAWLARMVLAFSRKNFHLFGEKEFCVSFICVSPRKKWLLVSYPNEPNLLYVYSLSKGNKEPHFLDANFIRRELGDRFVYFTFTNDDGYFIYSTSSGSLHALCLQTGTILKGISGKTLFSATDESQFCYLFQSTVGERKEIILTDLLSPLAFLAAKFVLKVHPSEPLSLCSPHYHSLMSILPFTHETISFLLRCLLDDYRKQMLDNFVLSPDGKLIAIHRGNNIELIRSQMVFRKTEVFTVYEQQSSFTATLTFSADSKLLLFCVQDGARVSDPHFHEWDVEKGELVSFKFPVLCPPMVECCCLSSDKARLILCGDNKVEIWKYGNGPCCLLESARVSSSYSIFNFSQCTLSVENNLLACSIENIVVLFSLRDHAKTFLAKGILRGHLARIVFCKFLKVNRYLITYDINGLVFLWDLTRTKAVAFAKITQDQESIVSLLVSPKEDKAVCLLSSSRICVIELCRLEEEPLSKPMEDTVSLSEISGQTVRELISKSEISPETSRDEDLSLSQWKEDMYYVYDDDDDDDDDDDNDDDDGDDDDDDKVDKYD